MSISLYAKFGSRLFKVGEKFGDRFILRPISGMPYQFIFATASQLRDRNLFQLFPIFQVVRS